MTTVKTPWLDIFYKRNASNSEYYMRGKFKMATLIRPEVSIKNKYWIDKHRHYELKHFCLQYPMWKKTYTALDNLSITTSKLSSDTYGSTAPSDTTAKCAIRKAYYSEKMQLVEKAALEADETLWIYILKAVTEGLSYTYLRTRMNIPCGKDLYYDRYRRFFWLLSEIRD